MRRRIRRVRFTKEKLDRMLDVLGIDVEDRDALYEEMKGMSSSEIHNKLMEVDGVRDG